MKKLNSSGNVVQSVSTPPTKPNRIAMRIAAKVFRENFEKHRLR